MGVPLAKLHEKPLADARGSDPSRDRQGAVSAAGVFPMGEWFLDSVSGYAKIDRPLNNDGLSYVFGV
jgi:hypothetical protein